jgi:hypothetical protein
MAGERQNPEPTTEDAENTETAERLGQRLAVGAQQKRRRGPSSLCSLGMTGKGKGEAKSKAGQE